MVPRCKSFKDRFPSDRPNADIYILEGNTLKQVVAVLRDTLLTGDSLTYTVRVFQ